jgi:hypothetical protein
MHTTAFLVNLLQAMLPMHRLSLTDLCGIYIGLPDSCCFKHNLLITLYTDKPARKDEIVNTCHKTAKQQSKHHEPGSMTRYHTAACASLARTRNQVDQCVPEAPAEVATCKPRNPTNTMCECSTWSGRDKGASIHLRALHCQVFMQTHNEQVGSNWYRGN